VKTSVKERWLGIYKIVYDLKEYKEVVEKLMERDKRDTLERRRATLEAYMGSALKVYLEVSKTEPETNKIPVLNIKFSDYWMTLVDKLGGTVDDIEKSRFRSPILDREISKKLIGLRLKNRFRARAYLWSNQRCHSILKSFVERSMKKYGLDKEDL